ncbi:MAG: zf-HC2 domain-containing protein [Chloroherpetonaceae bacterium]|nr:zf-HC2 domain-containing protein [Chthonomonadaceae bacterium]MDW8209160.1 zf-HC2 domain-containing protein [Chloroherpetonaceae bacterium]
MRCNTVHALLDLHLEQQLPEELAQQIERHLMRCAACAFEARTLEQTRNLLRAAIPPVAPSPSFRERAAARLQDALVPHLHPRLEQADTRQWRLPLLPED